MLLFTFKPGNSQCVHICSFFSGEGVYVVTCNLDIVYSGCVAERVVTACSLDIVIAAYLYTLPVTADVEWLHTICSDHVNESYSVYLYNVILNKRIMCHVQQYFNTLCS